MKSNDGSQVDFNEVIGFIAERIRDGLKAAGRLHCLDWRDRMNPERKALRRPRHSQCSAFSRPPPIRM